MFSQADAYERFMGRWSRLLAPALIGFAEVRPGDTVLDVGSGTGALSRALRAVTGVGAVTGVDPSEDFVSHAAAAGDAPLLKFQVGDARTLDFQDATFDKVLSALVLNFVPEPARAVREMIRVTKPGGVVAAAVWDYGDGMRMLRMFWDEATALDRAAAARDEAHMPLCRRGELAQLLAEQGLEDVQETPLSAELHFASFDDYWSPFLLGQGPAGAYAKSLPRDRQSALEQRLRERLVGDTTDHPLDMTVRAWAARGSVAR